MRNRQERGTENRSRAYNDKESAPRYVSFGCYQMNEEGLFTQGKDDEEVFVSGAFEVLGRVRDPRGEGWARLIRWHDDDNRAHAFTVSDADLHSDQPMLCANLASRGLKVATGRGIRAHLISYINQVSIKDRVTLVDRTGWHEVNNQKAFVLPGKTIGLAAAERLIIQDITTAPFATRGTLVDWQKGVGSLVMWHSLAVFAVSVSFAGPLLNLLGHEGCGFNL